jgi:uncharacterized protein
MNGTLLRFYVHEKRKLGHIPLYDWLLDEARRLGIHGGSVFRAIAGFGRHGIRHDERFFELAGDLPVAVDFAVSDADAQRLLDAIAQESVGVFYVRVPVEYGVVGGTAGNAVAE